MASILDFLDSDAGKKFIKGSSDQVNESPEKVKTVLGMALPMMLGALKNNTASSQGAENLNRALDNEKHSGSILNSLSPTDLSGLLGEGSGILGHIFGGKQQNIIEAVSSATGMDSSKVAQLLKLAAPVLMGILGNQKRKDNVGTGGLGELIGSVLGSNSSHDQSLLETFLNADGNSNVAGDIAGKLLGGKKDSKGLGSFFKG